MTTKKSLSILLVLCLILTTLVGCNSNNETEEELNEADSKAYEYEQAQKAYAELNEAAELCEYAMDVVYGAWYFAMYDAESGSADYKNYDGFEKKTGLTYDEIEAAMASLGLSYDDSFYLTDFNYAVKIAQICLNNKNIYEDARAKVENAKKYLKEVTDTYADYTAYPTLKQYYSEVSSYLEFAENPSGSFSQLKTTIDNYETNIRTYKNDLSFTFE